MTNNKYSFTAIFFHWFLAIAIFTLLASGFYMADLPFSMEKLKLINWHKWLGMTFLSENKAKNLFLKVGDIAILNYK